MAVLELVNLQKAFTTPDGERNVVVDVPRFSLDDGQHVALRGSSGSGKTTLLNLIAGILQADSGQVILAGTDLTQLSEAQRDRVRGRQIGYVFQTFNLLQGCTALENVALATMFGAGADYARAAQLLEKVGLKDRLHYRPRQLSIGQQQRVAVARALVNKPALVLADEPTGNLDERNAKEALQLIRATCKEFNAALLLVSHDRDILAQFENVHDLKELNHAGRRAEVGA
jgi:ABC-type lipoprotein export system ATPase subunit